MSKRGIQASFTFLAGPVLQDGLAAANEWERASLGVLYVEETRKGAFASSSNDLDLRRKEFCRHILSNFAESDELKQVINFQPRLLATARLLAGRRWPIEAVILYATWIEHWLNAVLLTTALRTGLVEADTISLIRAGSIRDKTGWLWRLLGLPPLPVPQERLIFLADIRNEHVHYKWKGQDPDTLEGPGDRLTMAVTEVDTIVVALVRFEVNVILQPLVSTASALFETDVAAELVSRNLEWKEILST